MSGDNDDEPVYDADVVQESTTTGGGFFGGGGGGYGNRFNNDPDSHYEVEHKGFGKKLGNSICGVCVGIVFFLGAFPLLWYNEGRAVDTYMVIKEGRSTVIKVNTTTINSANEGKLVYFTGLAEPTSDITDDIFGLEVSNKISLKRKVELYQWTESKSTTTKENDGGSTTKTTTYSYDKRWKDHFYDSSSFKKPQGHTNPQSMPYKYATFYSDVALGAFDLPVDLVRYLSSYSDLGSPPGLNVSTVPSSTRNALITGSNATVKTYPNGYYFGNTKSVPYVGHTRVTFQTSEGGQASVYGKQSGSSIVAYVAASGASLLRLDRGTVSVDEMFDKAKAENKALTMILRIVGAIVMAVGIGMVLSPLEVVADIIPCVGDIVGGAISCVSAIIAAILSLIVIGIAWVANRPIILGIAVAGLAIIGYFIYAARKGKQNNNQQAQMQGNMQQNNQQPQMQQNQGEPDIEVWKGEPDTPVWK